MNEELELGLSSEPLLITGVLSQDIGDAWPYVANYLKEARERGFGGPTVPQIHSALLNEQMQLWVVHDGRGRVFAACITQILKEGDSLDCMLVAVGGVGLQLWFDSGLEIIEEWAREKGVRSFRTVARKGWAKLAKSKGFKQTHCILEKRLDRTLH